jgi:hypothetical protein
MNSDLVMKLGTDGSYVVDEERSRHFPNMASEIDQEDKESFIKCIEESGVDETLNGIVKGYEKTVTNKTFSGAYILTTIKTWYDFVISYAKEKGLDISGHPLELCYLDESRWSKLK